MEKSHFIAFDLGATSGRCMAGSLSDKGLELKELTRFPNSMLLVGGHYYWDIFYESVQKRQIISQKYEAEILWGVKVLRAMKESSLQGRKIIL